MHVHFVGVQLAADLFVREYLMLPFAEHGKVDVVRNVQERRLCDTLAYLLVREPRLGVTDDSVADLYTAHFILEFNKLDYRHSLGLVLLINKGDVNIAPLHVNIAQSREEI